MAAAVRDPGNALAFAAIAVGFATRFFAMRVIATAIAVAATGLHVAYAWRTGGSPRELLGVAYFLAAILLLGGRALVTVFDDSPGRANFWRELPLRDRRRLAVLVHGVALTLAMLYYVRFLLVGADQAVPPWLTAGPPSRATRRTSSSAPASQPRSPWPPRRRGRGAWYA